MHAHIRTAAALGFTLATASSTLCQPRAVVMTGDMLPGFGTNAIAGFGSFRLNDLGQVAVRSSGSSVGGIWRFDPDGVVTPAAVSGDDIPGVSFGTFLNNFEEVSMNDLGQIAFNSFVSTTGRTVWITEANAQLTGPAFASNRTYLTSRLDNSGGLGVSSGISGDDFIGYVLPANNRETFATAVGQEAFADNGYAVYREVTNTQVFQEAITRLQSGQNRQEIARSGVQNGAGVTFGSLFGDASINAQGTLVFRASYTLSGGETGRGLWVGGTGFPTPQLLVNEGDAAPGEPGSTFNSLFTAELHDSGVLFFAAGVDSPSGDASFGIYAIDTVTRATTPILTEDTVIDGFGGRSIDRVNEWYANDNGSVVLAIELASEGATATEAALVGYDGGTGRLETLFQIGDMLEVAPGDEREIAALKLPGEITSGTSDQFVDLRTGVLNSQDEFVFRATFADGSSGLFVAGVAIDPCAADANGDGLVTPADFTAWVLAFNTETPGCDQNGDGLCQPSDFSAFIANYNNGCP
ncbi:MAG: choice-of-anchor tandem repeat NxxGxxAF-containing protein [Planctomycetota bacterium]